MTLATKMVIRTALLVLSLLVISAVSLWGLNGLSRDLDLALDEYRKIGAAYDTGVDLATVKALLSAGAVDDPAVLPRLDSAATKLGQLGKEYGGPWAVQMQSAVQIVRSVIAQVEAARANPGLAEERLEIAAQNAQHLTDVLTQLAEMLSQTRQSIRQTQEAATSRRQTTIAVVLILFAAMGVGAILISIGQYRGVMSPLRRLRLGVHGIAAGQFSNRLDTEGDREFAELAGDFNQMAAHLDSLYRELEQKVSAKSKELVRSERLASVGFLAAGVAHEINNPLGIISGYAELSLKKLDRALRRGAIVPAATGGPSSLGGAGGVGGNGPKPGSVTGREPTARPQPGDAFNDTIHALRIICDEAFRCKKIIEKLLTLARSGPDSRGPVNIGKVANDVADVIKGLPRYRDRHVFLKIKNDGWLQVNGNETQLNQVLLNLTINALEAVESGRGQVVIDVRRDGPRVEVVVRDNGKGMTQQTLDHVFEPFYTEKRGADGKIGTGLGLSISHAIVSDHGGQIRAESSGLGKGSRFIIHLPADGGARQHER